MLLVGIRKLHGTFRPFDSIQADMIVTFLLPPRIGYLTVETKTFLISGCKLQFVVFLLHETHKMYVDSLQQHDFLQNEFGKSIVLSA